MPAERPIHWSEGDIPEDYVAQNQLFWASASRGRISRPMEIPAFLSNSLHTRLTETFGIKGAEKPKVVWSVVFDNPKSPNSKYVYERRYPDDVEEEDRSDYAIGIERINEYASNYASREYIRRNTNVPVLRTLSKLYCAFSDAATYRLLLNGTYKRMAEIEKLAKSKGKDFKASLWEGLFDHNFDPVNEIISNSEDSTKPSNINDLAIEIGRSRSKKMGIGKLLGRLESNKNDGALVRGLKNAAISLVAAGVFRTPGVVELSAAMIALPAFTVFLATNAIVDYQLGFDLQHPELMLNSQILLGITSSALEMMGAMALILAPLIPFVGLHESIHDYSGGKDYLGFIPVKLVNKEVTPDKAKLEGD